MCHKPRASSEDRSFLVEPQIRIYRARLIISKLWQRLRVDLYLRLGAGFPLPSRQSRESQVSAPFQFGDVLDLAGMVGEMFRNVKTA